MSSSSGWMRTRPICCDSGSPTLVHDFPPSSDLYTPSPHEVLTRLRPLASPLPIHTTLGFVGATAMPPTAARSSFSNTGSHVVPPLTDFQAPL